MRFDALSSDFIEMRGGSSNRDSYLQSVFEHIEMRDDIVNEPDWKLLIVV